jgi:hypothetical protein
VEDPEGQIGVDAAALRASLLTLVEVLSEDRYDRHRLANALQRALFLAELAQVPDAALLGLLRLLRQEMREESVTERRFDYTPRLREAMELL